jgi:transposase, IS30 family
MPRWAHNKLPSSVRRQYFELIRAGHKGAEAARRVGVSTSCGSLWFIDSGSVAIPECPISAKFLSQDDRIAIADGLAARQPVKVIAATIGKSFQTVYREIKRNAKPDGRYQPWYAHNQAVMRRRRPRCHRIVAGSDLRSVIESKLVVRWSPQQISRYLKRQFLDDPTMRACPEAIYQAIFAGRLGAQEGKLRTGRCRRKRHRRGVAGPNKIKNMRPLTERPLAALDRSEVGHWEGDLIIGRHMHSAIATLVERVSRYTALVELPSGYKAPQLRDALTERFSALPLEVRKSLTWDQGREMTLHDEFRALSGVDVYFCDPHSPWQRPTNENTNGLLRQYFPKHTDLSGHDQAALDQVATELNQRPRLVLNDHTPEEVLASFLRNSHTLMFATTD